MTRWIPTRSEGLRRLDDFLPRAGRAYARDRNFDHGPGHHAAVSTLSPWIRQRMVLEEEVIAAVLRRHSFEAAEKFIQEVLWRTYWKGWLELRPGIWGVYRGRVSSLSAQIDRDADLRERWQTATGGHTGIECFDAWAHELMDTGYLHNHARMWFASIWIFTLELPWELGADFFMRHLLDGDPASNTLSWRWVGGLQTPGKTYLARAGNIARFTGGRFKPTGKLSTLAPPPARKPVPDPVAPPDHALPDPTLRTALLLTDEDLVPESLPYALPLAADVAVLTAGARRSPLGVSQQVLRFVDGAVDDALERGALHTAVRVDLGATEESLDKLIEWAVHRRLQQIVTPYAPVGPTAEALDRLAVALAKHDVTLVRVLRAWDQCAWPHATHGFFKFRKQIPVLVRSLCDSASSAA